MDTSSSIWTEKYRPKKFEELVGQEEVVKKVENLTKSMNIPHLLFAGPAGTGKSTLALIVVKELFGSTWKENYLELNASDERGIDVVRQKVKDFARTKALGDVPFKVIFLDLCLLFFFAQITSTLPPFISFIEKSIIFKLFFFIILLKVFNE